MRSRVRPFASRCRSDGPYSSATQKVPSAQRHQALGVDAARIRRQLAAARIDRALAGAARAGRVGQAAERAPAGVAQQYLPHAPQPRALAAEEADSGGVGGAQEHLLVRAAGVGVGSTVGEKIEEAGLRGMRGHGGAEPTGPDGERAVAHQHALVEDQLRRFGRGRRRGVG